MHKVEKVNLPFAENEVPINDSISRTSVVDMVTEVLERVKFARHPATLDIVRHFEHLQTSQCVCPEKCMIR